jgi:hypothetical protein
MQSDLQRRIPSSSVSVALHHAEPERLLDGQHRYAERNDRTGGDPLDSSVG